MTTTSIRGAAACLILVLAALGCATSRTTTTARTAVEQALISQSVAGGVAELDAAPAVGRTFALIDEQFSPTDKEFVSTAIRARLLESGLHEEGGKDEAEILVYPRSYYLAIDDTKFLVGIPSFKLPTPGGVAFETPEVAFFRKEVQKGRSRFAVHGKERETGAHVFSSEPPPKQRYYTRWTVLILFTFRTTDLGPPF